MSEMIRYELPVKEIRAYCETQPIERLSALGTDFDAWLRPDTDIGLLVEYVPGEFVTYIDMARQEREIGEIINGTVDLRTPNELASPLRPQIIEGAKVVFAQNSRE